MPYLEKVSKTIKFLLFLFWLVCWSSGWSPECIAHLIPIYATSSPLQQTVPSLLRYILPSKSCCQTLVTRENLGHPDCQIECANSFYLRQASTISCSPSSSCYSSDIICCIGNKRAVLWEQNCCSPHLTNSSLEYFPLHRACQKSDLPWESGRTVSVAIHLSMSGRLSYIPWIYP